MNQIIEVNIADILARLALEVYNAIYDNHQRVLSQVEKLKF